tara:strand:- start:1088 stop:1615 length:528 start_codon:yes stop_codon:yes gene_type:complete
MIISGTYGLALFLSKHFDNAKFYSVYRLLDESEYLEKLESNILINCEHHKFKQVELLDLYFNKWRNIKNKYIINISSRAAQPNISKGYLYASQKAALNHYTNNIVYNSDKVCRVTTLNLGLMKHKTLPSISYQDVADTIEWLIDSDLDIPDMTVQHPANYGQVQHAKSLNKSSKK